MDAPTRRYDFRVIARELIDPPEIPMRESMDDDALGELAENIRAHGIRQPLGVRPVGDRFRISWGHRRFMASGLAGEAVLPCAVLADDDVTEEQYKNDENRFQETVNPAEEATYLLRLYHEKCGQDIDRLAALTGKKVSRLLERLDLTRGDEMVFEALKRKSITLALAQELNKVKDEGWRRFWLHDAIEQGMTAKAVRTLRQNLDVQRRVAGAEADGTIAAIGASTEAAYGSIDLCPFCLSARDQHDMEYVRVHRSCRAVAIRQREEERGQ